MIDNGGRAFPAGIHILEDSNNVMGGMTLRDWFASQAITRMKPPVEYVGIEETQTSYKQYAKKAYKIADALIKQRGVS